MKEVDTEQSKWVFLDDYRILSSETSYDMMYTTTRKVNGVEVEKRVGWETQQMSSEEKRIRLQADISYCDSVCLKSCAYFPDADEPMFS